MDPIKINLIAFPNGSKLMEMSLFGILKFIHSKIFPLNWFRFYCRHVVDSSKLA